MRADVKVKAECSDQPANMRPDSPHHNTFNAMMKMTGV